MPTAVSAASWRRLPATEPTAAAVPAVRSERRVPPMVAFSNHELKRKGTANPIDAVTPSTTGEMTARHHPRAARHPRHRSTTHTTPTAAPPYTSDSVRIVDATPNSRPAPSPAITNL